MTKRIPTNLPHLLKTTRSIREYVSPYLKPDNGYVLLMCVLIICITIANTTLIWYLGTAVNQISSGVFSDLAPTLIWLAIIVIVNQTMIAIYYFLFHFVYLRFVARLRKAALLNIMNCSYPVLSQFKKGDMMARITSDIDSLKTFILEAPLGFLSDMLVFAFYISMLFWIDVGLAVVALGLAPMFYITQHIFGPLKGKAATNYFQRNGELIAFEEQVMGNLRGISSFTAENRVSEKHNSVFEIARSWVLKMRVIDNVYDRLITVLVYLAGVVIVYWGIEDIESGQLQVGTLVSFIVYLGYLSVPVRGIAQLPIRIQGDISAAHRVIDLMKYEPAIKQLDNCSELKVTRGEIHFDNVSFGYQPLEKLVFSNLTEIIRPGECVALVGPSGSGKSTFANLLLRFYDPQQGKITIDGTDIKSVALSSLRNNIGIVWQEPFFINDTIRENLRLPNPDVTDPQIIDACKSSFAWDYIGTFEKGLDTVIGTQGVSLSVGQFQRLAIAQAFIRNSPILILDEASSALDSHSEQKVVDALDKLRKNHTTLIIAHRYSSIRAADRVIYFNGDGSVTSGTHEELLRSHPGYQQAVEWQTRVE